MIHPRKNYNMSTLIYLKMKTAVYLLGLLIFCGCSSNDGPKNDEKRIIKGEYIYRLHNETLFSIPAPIKKNTPLYPWDGGNFGKSPRITKEYFRCKGSNLNPPKMVLQNKETVCCQDCGGTEKHSLPLRDGKEFIYPILIDLLNYVQIKTGKKVVITCGHRCPEHNAYSDPLPSARYSKHMIGAETSFYVQGFEDRPEYILKLLQGYYAETPKYQGRKEYQEFHIYDKEDTDVSTPPCYNKEVFIKLYKKKEGRNEDNRHPYPYISIQVRFDMDRNEKVVYSWEQAFKSYLRK